jgi:hypothetical protein
VLEIRSYRRVFDLERRIYRVDRLRLNPAGVPVRGIVYLLVILAATVLASRLPVVGLPIRGAPWLLSYLAFPGLTAALLAVIRIEGRPFHLAARALLRYRTGPRLLYRLGPAERRSAMKANGCWTPTPIMMLPDGADGMHRLRYDGPGALLVAIEHERKSARGLLVRLGLRPDVVVLQASDAPRHTGRSVIVLGRGARASVR